MARQQYRWFGEGLWQGQSGNAILAIQNKTGSGKKVLIHSFEVFPQSVGKSADGVILDIIRGTSDINGQQWNPSAHDKNNSLPSDIIIQTNNGFLPTGNPLVSKALFKIMNIGAASGLVNHHQQGGLGNNNRFQSIINTRQKNSISSLENIIIRQNESIAISARNLDSSKIIRVSYTFIVRGTPNKTFSGDVITWVSTGRYVGTTNTSVTPFSITNNSSTNIIEILSIDITEVGTLDTPYLQLVPIGSIDSQSQADDSIRQSVTKMDSIYPDLDSNKVQLLCNAPLKPYGMPEGVFSQASTGSPKGYNYLHTKDFVGPQYMVFFPEVNRYGATNVGTNDMRLLSIGRKHAILAGDKGSTIVVREGEQVGIVSGAETAITAGTVGTSGWQLINFAITFSVENAFIPELTLTGLKPNTEVRIMDANTNTEIAGQEDVTTGTFTWQYDFDEYQNVDINIVSLGYEILRYNNLTLNAQGLSIPVTQRVDRNYLNQ